MLSGMALQVLARNMRVLFCQIVTLFIMLLELTYFLTCIFRSSMPRVLYGSK